MQERKLCCRQGRSEHNIRESLAVRRLGHLITLNFAVEEWNALNASLS